MADPGEQVYTLNPLPTHLWQLDHAAKVTVGDHEQEAYNDMGCGAFSTSIALSVFAPQRATLQAATSLYQRMRKVPFTRGTWEGENARLALEDGYVAANLSDGTPAELANLVKLNAPAVLNINPRRFLAVVQYGAHDVALAGYSSDAGGAVAKIFVLDPWRETGNGSVGGHEDYPGNRYFVTGPQEGEQLSAIWTRTFTPIFRDAAQAREWLAMHPNRAASFKF